MHVPFVSFDRFSIDWHAVILIGILVVIGCGLMYAFGYGMIWAGEWFHQFEDPTLVAEWCAEIGYSINSTKCE